MSEPAKRYYKTLSDNMHLQAEIARLKAEVERLTKHDDNTCRHFIMRTLLESQNTFLNARVERLTKAGDAMANNIPFYADVDISAETLRQFTDKWLAAKEGKPCA